jgi:CHAT domain-containing protein/tetratricopeptide (TPR) repeat protein
MDFATLTQQLSATPDDVAVLVTPLDTAGAAALVDHLKSEADRHWWINANRSLELAELIMAIGQARGDTSHIALGTMARGDALKLLGQLDEAWQTLDQAGALFQGAGDEVGWARTRIGRLAICVDLNQVAQALLDADHARAIFIQHNLPERRLVLDLNTATVYNLLGDQHQALALYDAALATADALGERGQSWIAPISNNMGNVYHLFGDFRQALVHYERALAIRQARGETSEIALTELNVAHLAMDQGHYRRALQLLHRAHAIYTAEQLTLSATNVSRHIIECYLLVNRYAEARELAQQVIAAYRHAGAAYFEGRTLLHLATAEAEIGRLEASQDALDAAEPIFRALGAATLVATTQLRRGQIALRQGDVEAAKREARASAASFAGDDQQVHYATATLLLGQASLAAGEPDAAARAATDALRIARRSNIPPLRYSAHLLLGHIAEQQGDWLHARRRYYAAIATVERVQQGLTITLRPSFLEDKGEALRALLGLELRAGRIGNAFDSLERAKSNALLAYLANRDRLHWSYDDPESRALIDELEQLREEHQWLYRLAHEQPDGAGERARPITPEQAQARVTLHERRMRAITEQLYLIGGERGSESTAAPRLGDVQRSLDHDTLLVEFYNDGQQLWAFSVDRSTVEIHRLPATVAEIDQLLAQLQANIRFALNAGAHAPSGRTLANVGRRVLQRLHAALIAPLNARAAGRLRLVIVPYGALHYLPMHLLHDGAQYLIERHEVVILPAAGLLLRRAPGRAPGARILAHSWDGRLPQTRAEAQIVQRLVGGRIYAEQAASRAALRDMPTQILHIAAHGEHRLDQPDLSFIQLADGQLYTDDLLQHDVSYELVTLSACETGRANIAAGDEPIGLGRGFLYAGAGALLVSLWQVADMTAASLMEHVYQALSTGASRAAALRQAQCAMLAEQPQLHPALWGAFQLVGDAGPLSSTMSFIVRKDHEHAVHTTTA